MKCILIFALLFVSCSLADQYVHFHGYKVIRAVLADQQAINEVSKLELDVWSHDSTLVKGENDIMVNAEQEEKIRQLGIGYEVFISDVEERITEERNTIEKLSALGEMASWFDTYHNYSDIVAFYTQLASTYPTLVHLNSSIGKSIEGRDIMGLTLGKSTATKKIYFEGGQHAREWIGHATVAYLVNQVVTTYNTDATAKAILDNLQIVVAPVVNPDGYVYTWTTNRLWRKNRRANTGGTFGVDLNRNWDDQWGTVGTSHTPSSDTYCGTAPFSEPESKAVSQYITQRGPFKLAVDYHSYSQLILRPLGYIKTPPANNVTAAFVGDNMRAAILKVHNVPYTSEMSWELYYTSGSASDWFFDKANIPLSYTIELRDTGKNGFQLPPDQIIPTGQENYAAFIYYADYVLKNN